VTTIKPAQKVFLQMYVFIDPSKYEGCSLTNTAMILQAPGGSVQNTNLGNDQQSSVLNFQPLQANGKTYCYTPEPSTACPPGFDWNGEECERGGISTPPPVPPRPTTPEVDEDCPQGYRGTPPNCRRIVQPDPKCPEGYRGTPPNCRRIVQPDPDPVCTGNRILRNGECVCRRGLVWNGKRCVRPEPECTGGRILSKGECVCRRGRGWNGQRCVRPLPTCTGNRVLRNGDCVCRGRLVWNGKRCVRPRPQCTGGRILRNGECVCRGRLVWNGSRCVRVVIPPKLRVPETSPEPKRRIPRRLLNPNSGNTIR
jgi:hypothetical protein